MEEMGEIMINGMSEWTLNTLRAHIDRVMQETDRRYEERFEGQEKAVQAALAAQEKAVSAALAAAALAVDKAEQNAEKWRNNANEWRDAMDDREADFMGQDVAITRFTAIERMVADLRKSRDQGEGRLGGISAGWGYLVGFIGLIGAIISILATR